MKTKQPPSNAVRITCVADLPSERSVAAYVITEDDSKRQIFLSKRQRQVLDLLMATPVYAASPVRISDMVLLLREIGLEIETEMFDGDPGTGVGRFGVYLLKSRVARVSEHWVAA